MNRELAGAVTRIALSITDQNTDAEMIRALAALASEVNRAPSTITLQTL